jgi:hypothetical protein
VPKIMSSMPVEDLVEKFPWVIGELARRRVVCLQCGEPVWGTLEEAARKAGILDIEGLIAELNRIPPEPRNAE